MEVQEQSSPLKLHVSCLLVRDRPLDTLWIDRPLTFKHAYNPEKGFIDTSSSKVMIIRSFPSPPETTLYAQSAANTRAWLPVSDTAPLVESGARYRLSASIRWNAAASYPSGEEFRVDTLSAETYVQSVFSIPDTVSAPLEFLHPSLAAGLPTGSVEKARKDPDGYLNTLYDSVNGLPEPGSLEKLGVSKPDFLEYLNGEPILRPVRSEDTLNYIWDPTEVVDIGGGPIKRYFRGLSIEQNIDPEQYGGLIIIQKFDSTRAYINNPIDQDLEYKITPGKIDTPAYYQKGTTRVQEVLAKAIPDKLGYPRILKESNLLFAYTGRNVLYYYAVDSLYYEYYRRYLAAGSNTQLNYSNVENGDGYFTGAALDSLAFVLTSARDTIPVQVLRKAWLESEGNAE
jgi:hypothetical protein